MECDEDIIKLDIFNKNEDDNFICFDMNVYNEFNDCIRHETKGNYLSSKTLFLADLPLNGKKVTIDEEFLREIFEEYNISNKPEVIIIKIRKSGSPYCFAFIEMESQEDVMRAVIDLNYTKLVDVLILLMLAGKDTKRIVISKSGLIILLNIYIFHKTRIKNINIQFYESIHFELL